ncbi:hypothetical protein DOK_11976 [gamma proteobacterium BDW918]|nr:hypothetical protein DOK_11976 [gamma proteobacterium BDW918]
MKNLDLQRELNRLRTSELLSEKVVCTVKIAIYKLIELGLLSVVGGFAAFVMPKMFAGTMQWDHDAKLFLVFVVYAAMVAVVTRFNHGYELAKKELIIDLLAFRMNNTGRTKTTKSRKAKVDKAGASE